MHETARVQKLITFSPQLYEIVRSKAGRLGLSFGEHMRYLAVSDVKEEAEHLPIVDRATNARIGQSLTDIEEGRYTDVDVSNKAKGTH